MARKGKLRNNKIKKTAALEEGRKVITCSAPDYVGAGQRVTKYAAGGKCLPLLNRSVLENIPGYDGVPGSTVVLLFRHPTDSAKPPTPTHVQYWQGHDNSEVCLLPLDIRESPVVGVIDSSSFLYTLEETVFTERDRKIFSLMHPSIKHEMLRYGKDFGKEEFDMAEGLIEIIYEEYSSFMETGDVESALGSGLRLAREFVEADRKAKFAPFQSEARQRHLHRASMTLWEPSSVTPVQYIIRSQPERVPEVSST